MTDQPIVPEIRMFPDYAGWPLWGEMGLLDPDDSGLSTDLTEALLAWDRFWEENFHHDAGWREPRLRAGWIEEGREIARRLRAEVGPGKSVEYDENQYGPGSRL